MALAPPVLALLPRAVAVQTETLSFGSRGRAGVVTWTNARAAGSALNLKDALMDNDGFLQQKWGGGCSKDAVVSFNRRGLARLPPDFASLCSSLVIFSCSGNSLQRLDFGGKAMPHLRQLDCRCPFCSYDGETSLPFL